jgi:hypothetical protein
MTVETDERLCANCGRKTTHIYTGKGFPKPLRWRCSVCGDYTPEKDEGAMSGQEGQVSLDFSGVYEGRKLAEKGMSASWAASPEEWRATAWDMLLSLARSRRPFNADEIKARIGPPPRPGAVGALFSKARRRKVIEIVGMRPMAGARAHARTTFLYRGTDD